MRSLTPRVLVDFKLGMMKMMKRSLRKHLSLEVERRPRGIVAVRSQQRQRRLKSQKEKRSLHHRTGRVEAGESRMDDYKSSSPQCH